MAEPYPEVKRLSWEQWKATRESKRRLLAEKGLDASCRRSTAKPVAQEAARRFSASPEALESSPLRVHCLSAPQKNFTPAAAAAGVPQES